MESYRASYSGEPWKRNEENKLVCSLGSPGFLGLLCVRPQAGDLVRGSMLSEIGTLLWLI